YISHYKHAVLFCQSNVINWHYHQFEYGIFAPLILARRRVHCGIYAGGSVQMPAARKVFARAEDIRGAPLRCAYLMHKNFFMQFRKIGEPFSKTATPLCYNAENSKTGGKSMAKNKYL